MPLKEGLNKRFSLPPECINRGWLTIVHEKIIEWFS